MTMSANSMSLACSIGAQRAQCRTAASNQNLDPMPVLDFSKLAQHSGARALVIKDLGRACQTLGCFQVINHGINESVIDGALEVASRFSALSAEAKTEFASNDLSKPVRYGANTKDGISKARDVLKLYANPLSDWIHLWPETPQGYREKMGNYSTEVRRVALELIGAILESLGLDQAYMSDKLEKGMQIMATNFYPQCSEADIEVGLDSHSDHGFITILLQSCDGLQVRNQEGGWKIVQQLPNSLHVNIGDNLEILSNGRYKSLIHRSILNSEMKRISIASIHTVTMEDKVAPAKELVNEQNPKGYKEGSFKDFLDYLSNRNGRKNMSFLDSLKIMEN